MTVHVTCMVCVYVCACAHGSVLVSARVTESASGCVK